MTLAGTATQVAHLAQLQGIPPVHIHKSGPGPGGITQELQALLAATGELAAGLRTVHGDDHGPRTFCHEVVQGRAPRMPHAVEAQLHQITAGRLTQGLGRERGEARGDAGDDQGHGRRIAQCPDNSQPVPRRGRTHSTSGFMRPASLVRVMSASPGTRPVQRMWMSGNARGLTRAHPGPGGLLLTQAWSIFARRRLKITPTTQAMPR